jgi:hypothetical protein
MYALASRVLLIRKGKYGMRLLLVATLSSLLAAAPAVGFQHRDDRIDHYAREHGISLEEAGRRLRLMNEVHAELPRLQQLFERHEKGNYANLWMEHTPTFRVVVAFKKDAEATLRRYTSNPAFVARQVRYSMEELEAARSDAEAQLSKIGAPMGMSDADEVGNEVDIVMLIEQPEVDKLLASGKLRLHPAVKVTGPKPLPYPAVSDEAARMVKIFPQRKYRTIGGTRELGYGTIVLRDGCLRFDRPGDDDPFVLFTAEVELGVDEKGRLAFINRETGKARVLVGEPLALSGGAGGNVTDPEIVGPINAACGPGKVAYSGFFESRAAFEGRNPR